MGRAGPSPVSTLARDKSSIARSAAKLSASLRAQSALASINSRNSPDLNPRCHRVVDWVWADPDSEEIRLPIGRLRIGKLNLWIAGGWQHPMEGIASPCGAIAHESECVVEWGKRVCSGWAQARVTH